jgi:extracellular factor (EF) 3-hydroxypalmitic acid methyl ester biosynthesis protein
MKTYEDLTGAAGRHIFFRAERFAARDLFTRMAPKVVIEGAPYSLMNLSMSGLAATTSRSSLAQYGRSNREPLKIGTEVEVVLEGDSGSLFSAACNLRRIEDRSLDSLLGVSFKGTSLDVAALVNRHNQALIYSELNGGLSHALDLVPPDYRRFCADVLDLLRSYRSTLSRFENISNREGETADLERVEALYEAAEERLIPEWHLLSREARNITYPMMADPNVLRAAKAFTERLITPELMGGPIWNRCYRKPFGYPGDYQLMNYVYEWLPRGANVYERLLHRIGLEMLECIATRMVMVQHAIAGVVASGAGSRKPARVLSLGCGSAQEVVNYLAVKRLPRAIDITLVDQDHRALDYAYGRVYPEILRLDNGSNVQCLEVSFVQLAKASGAVVDLPPQDLIYSIGLLDYLPQKRAKQFVYMLYDKLLPGGQLVIGNVAETPIDGRWSNEFICDWSLIFRTERDMVDIAATVPDARWEIRPDSTGNIHMLYLTKPA